MHTFIIIIIIIITITITITITIIIIIITIIIIIIIIIITIIIILFRKFFICKTRNYLHYLLTDGHLCRIYLFNSHLLLWKLCRYIYL